MISFKESLVARRKGGLFSGPSLGACFFVFGLTWALAGCGNPTPVPEEKLNRAQDALKSSLDAWKKGGKPQTLKAVQMEDVDWNAGLKLADYMIYNAESGGEGKISCGVVLSLGDGQGKKIDKEVVYEISEKEKIVIGRKEKK